MLQCVDPQRRRQGSCFLARKAEAPAANSCIVWCSVAGIRSGVGQDSCVYVRGGLSTQQINPEACTSRYRPN